MKLSLKIAFTVFVLSLLFALIWGLRLVWQTVPPSEVSRDLLLSSIIVMSGAFIYIAGAQAVGRTITEFNRQDD